MMFGIVRTIFSRILNTFEMVLCFHASMNLDVLWARDDENASQEFMASICIHINNLVEHLPQKDEDHNWNYPKVHELMHVTHAILEFGSPKNTSTSTGKRLHSLVAKKAGRRAGKKHASYNYHVGQRLADSLVLDIVTDQFDKYEKIQGMKRCMLHSTPSKVPRSVLYMKVLTEKSCLIGKRYPILI